MNSSRDNILNNLLKHSIENKPSKVVEKESHNPLSSKKKIESLKNMLESVRAEVHLLTSNSLNEWINSELPKRNLSRLLIGNDTIQSNLGLTFSDDFDVTFYTENIEKWKDKLFNEIDVGITTTTGAIARTGSLVLWPNSEEPRLISLVPDVHIAIVKVDEIYETFSEIVEKQNWSENMPTNALLISGPSKTADIEQVLAYGVHGPKELIVLIVS
ncbi:MAG: lactate utilization protein [Gammaproteobacteria bacterium]|nr:lactate utilization protein [Gammaproteobacteria bacterium]